MGLFADGCAVRQVGELTFDLVRTWVDEIVLVSNDEVCSAIQRLFESRRTLAEPSGAMGLAGLLKWAQRKPGTGALATVLTGANLNFDRLPFICERARFGASTEAIFAVEIPEMPGAFKQLCKRLGSRPITEFNYRFGDSKRAHVFVGFGISSQNDRERAKDDLLSAGYPLQDLTDDETAKMHLRHMVGGRTSGSLPEFIYRVEFPERAGALREFLDQIDPTWNISLFHYRNHGADRGRALIGFQVPDPSIASFKEFVASLPASECTDDNAVQTFLG